MDFTLLEFVPDAMVIVDQADGRIVHVNCVAEELFGYAREELIGQPVEVLLPSRYREAHRGHREGYGAAPRTRPMGLGLDLAGLRKGGDEFPAEIGLSPLEAEGGRYAITAIRDVGERRKLEERARLYRQAQEEVRRRDEFLSIASHELRTPVAALQLQLQILHRVAEQAQSPLPRQLVDKVEGLERQTRRLTVLVNELLDVSRMRLGRLELRLEEMDLADLAREAVRQLEAELGRSGSRIAVRAEVPASGRWDRLRLEQVITNLLVNAAKFGEGRPIAVTVSAADGLARLTVADQGIGIPAEHQERIFGRFERAASAEHYGGLGLGLYIAREIVEAHGGRIRLASSPGLGSTFTVELPTTPAAVQAGSRGPRVSGNGSGMPEA
ncbi:MAG TPA: PAS domain-containing sensor histidine kinase [Anaeromyxobacteraceae bacterium]|nr:PAS domain-containing sensor histidine kinase [Anaeromyxobacteraceae bacterium]